MKKTILGGSIVGISALLPMLAFGALDFTDINSSINSVTGIINSLIPVIIGIALLLFLIGILQYVTAGGDEEKRAAARGLIIFGIIALFVMVAAWGFVKILTSTFFGNSNYSAPPNLPYAPIGRPQ